MPYGGGMNYIKYYEDGNIKIEWKPWGVSTHMAQLYIKRKILFGLISYWYYAWHRESSATSEDIRRMSKQEVIKIFDDLYADFRERFPEGR